MLKILLERLAVISILSLVLLIFVQEFLNAQFLFLETLVLILVVFICIVRARGSALYISLITLVVGHVLLFKYEMGYTVWFEAITKNVPLGVLFVMVPVLIIPIKIGGYLEAFNYYISKYFTKSHSIFSILSSFVFGLGSITNLGALRITYSLIENIKLPKKFLAKVFGVGFSSCMCWSPCFASVNLVLYYTGVSFGDYFFFGFLYGILMLLLGNLLFYFDLPLRNELKATLKVSPLIEGNKKKMIQLIFNLVLLYVVVVLGEKITKFSSIMLLVSFIAAFYGAIWSVFLKKFHRFWLELKSYDQSILQVTNEFVFFICVGFFGVILAKAPVHYFIETAFRSISGLSPFLLVEFIIIITVLLSSIGFHHVITITTFALSLKPAMLGLSDIAFTLTLVVAYTISMIISPFVPANMVIGGLIQEKTFVIGLKWNRNFGFIVIVISGIYIILVNRLF